MKQTYTVTRVVSGGGASTYSTKGREQGKDRDERDDDEKRSDRSAAPTTTGRREGKDDEDKEDKGTDDKGKDDKGKNDDDRDDDDRGAKETRTVIASTYRSRRPTSAHAPTRPMTPTPVSR